MEETKPIVIMQSPKITGLIICLLVQLFVFNAKANDNSRLKGFNWYGKPEISKKEEAEAKKVEQEAKLNTREVELPDYEKNIRDLKRRHEEAHRRALDNPTHENILVELYLEKEMMNKSKLYGERRAAVAMLDAKFTDMNNHSNVLHRSVQEQKEEAEDSKKLKALSKDWGLILQVSEECPHCHIFAPIVLEFAKAHGFQLLAASKAGQDFQGIEGVADLGQMLVFNPERATPVLFLVKSDGKEVWPIARGVNSADDIIKRIKQVDKHFRRLF